jgi:stress-induced morphogen
MMDKAVLEQLISDSIPDSDVCAVDLQGTGDHFEVTVVSPGFEGRSLVQRHRMIYEAIGEAMRGPIHAMTIKALTPDQFQGDMVEPTGDGDRRD